MAYSDREIDDLQTHVYERWRTYVSGICYYHLQNWADSEDVAQEVFYQICKNIRNGNVRTLEALAAEGGVEGTDFRKHIAAITRNCIVDWLRKDSYTDPDTRTHPDTGKRKRKRKTSADIDDPEITTQVYRQQERHDTGIIEDVLDALQRSEEITAFEAKIFVHYHFSGDKIAELAQEYGSSTSAIHRMLKKTAARLERILGDQE